MILENGLIRTLDPQVPTQRALAIAGDRIAGGVGVHETALASPEVTDLGGRVVVPGFTDSHTHFPTWALSRHDVNLVQLVSRPLPETPFRYRFDLVLDGHVFDPELRSALSEVRAQARSLRLFGSYPAEEKAES